MIGMPREKRDMLSKNRQKLPVEVPQKAHASSHPLKC
jgi:hypothetical protein